VLKIADADLKARVCVWLAAFEINVVVPEDPRAASLLWLLDDPEVASGLPEFAIVLATPAQDTTILEWSESGAFAVLAKPLEARTFLGTVLAGLARTAELQRLRDENRELSSALQSDRVVRTAVGILAGRYGIPPSAAFERLRRYARVRRTRVGELAQSIVGSAESLHGLLNDISEVELKP
jgi:AmiR/NasT family two-component response regulator